MCKFVKCFFAIFVRFFGFILFAGDSFQTLKADPIPDIVARSKPAIIEIVAFDSQNKPIQSGTGFFVTGDGVAVTNLHVIQGASSLAGLANDGALFPFERILYVPSGVDLAILKFSAHDAQWLKLGRSDSAMEGQRVLVIGNPTGLQGTVSDGLIAAFRENRSIIQITAPISPASSGSPVFDENGLVIGVATLQRVEGQNLNFAIAVENVSAALDSLTAPVLGPKTKQKFSSDVVKAARLTRLKKQVDLTEDQESKAKPIIDKYVDDRQTANGDHAKLVALKTNFDSDINTILTPNQQKRFAAAMSPPSNN